MSPIMLILIKMQTIEERGSRTVSIFELAKLVGVSRRTILRDIEILKTEGKLQRVGSEKAGHWIISNQNN